MATKRRPSIPCEARIAVWAAAAGRCTFCNSLVSENEDLGEVLSIGELAHNVGWDAGSPRGQSSLTTAERSRPENLLLLCRNCHKAIDADDNLERYTVETLLQYKQEHEARIRELTSIGGDRSATIIRVVSDIRGRSPELTRQTVLAATTAARCFPKLLPWCYWPVVEIDVRDVALETATDFEAAAKRIASVAARINDGVRKDEVARLAVFAFARIPLLVQLGAVLDDKIDTLIFQRQRVDGVNAWRWPADPPPPPAFAFRELQPGTDPQRVALIINLSGTIHPGELPTSMQSTHTIYLIEPLAPALPDPTLLSSEAALKNFEQALRQFLAHVERVHPGTQALAIFPAIPLAAAVTLGRVLMSNVSPALELYERGTDRMFFRALEVRR